MLLRTEKLLKVFLKRVTPLQFTFCMSKSQMSPLLKVAREKAQLASDLIDLISSESVDQARVNKSLKENILDVIKTKHSLELESRKQFELFFIDGIKVDHRIFPQQNIRNAENPQSQKVVFYPTEMVTGQVFRFLKNPPLSTSLFAGQFGIAKTTSVCLFYYLTKIIDEYRFMEGVEVDEKMRKIPKIVYWPIVMTNYKLESIKELIVYQCPEINNQKYIKDIDSFQDSTKLFEYYQRALPEVQLILVIDQIETLESQQKKFAEASKKPPYQLNSQQKVRVQQIAKMFKSIQNIILHFSTRIYLSSMNLENKRPYFPQFISRGSQPLHYRLRIYYQSIFYKPLSLMELVNYFLFEVEQRIISQIQNKEIFEKIKQALHSQCYSYLESKKSEFFVTPQDFNQCIRGHVENQQRFQYIKNICVSQNSLKQLLFNVFRQQIDNTKERYVNLLKENFQKNDGKDRSRKRLMLQMYQRCQKFQKNKQLYEGLKKEQNIIFHSKKINIKNLSWSKESIAQLLDPRFFDFEYIDQGFIEPLLPIQFLQKVLAQYFSQYYDEYLRYIKYFLKGSQNLQQFGNIVKNLLFLILKNGKTHAVLRLGNLKNKNESYKVDFNFQTSTIFGFEALPKVQSQQYSFFSRLKDKIDQMMKMGKSSAAFFPLKREFLQQTQQVELWKINENSKMIDFIWVQCNIGRSGGQIIVWIIDVTVNPTEVQKKLLNFLKEFPKFSDRHQTSFRYRYSDWIKKVNYVVFGPKNVDLNKQTILKKFNQNQSNQGLKFEQNTPPSSKMLQVKSFDNKKCLLDYVGYVDMSTDLTIEKEESEQKKTLQSMEKLIIKRLILKDQLKK